MKNYFLIFGLIFFVSSDFASGTGFVRLVGKQFKDGDGNNFYPVIMNYYVNISYNTYPFTQASDLDINPWNNFGSHNYFENLDGVQAVTTDLHKIAQMGFNAIRLIFGLKRYNEPAAGLGCVSNGPLFTMDWFLHSYDPDTNVNANNRKCFAIRPPYSSDISVNLEMALYLQKVEETISLAEQEGLKVILLTADGYELFSGNGSTISNQDAVDDYAAFLQVLTAYFSTDSTIMAYDLDNEPHFKDGNHNYYTRLKQEVCEFSAQLYDAIKPGLDNNHLITIGLGDEGTLETWDPEVIKADFVSLHFYPYFENSYGFQINSRQDVMANLTERLYSKIYWATTYLNKPWVLEETGFSSTEDVNADDYWNWYGVNGSYSELSSFISNLLPVVKDCGVSGIAWWNFQDSYSTSTPDSVHDPNDKSYREECWGLLKRGDPVGTDYSVCEKITTNPFVGFDQIPPQTICSVTPPPNYVSSSVYYDPYLNHLYNSNPGASTVYGTVTDVNSNPIKGALVQGWSWLKTTFNGQDYEYSDYHLYTFTDESGHYELIPFNYNADHFNDNRLTHLVAVSLGAKGEGIGYSSEIAITGEHNFVLRKTALDYDSEINITPPVNLGEERNFSGWNTLKLSGKIEGVSEVSARREINLEGEFEANVNSEVHIFTSEVFSPCTSFTGYRLASSFVSENTVSENKVIILNFNSDKDKFSFKILPQPNNGIFTINQSKVSDDSITKFSIRKITGEMALAFSSGQKSVDVIFPDFSKGIYIVEALNESEIYISKLIIQ